MKPIILPFPKDKYIDICIIGKAKDIHTYYPYIEQTDDYIIFVKYTDGTYNIITLIQTIKPRELSRINNMVKTINDFKEKENELCLSKLP